MRRSSPLLLVAFCLAGANALPAQAGSSEPELIFAAKNRSITAPAVSGAAIAWISGPRNRPGECVRGSKRLHLRAANGKIRVLTHRERRNYETGCLYRPVLAGRFTMWSTPGREFISARKRGRLRAWRACCGQNIEHHHDITPAGDLHWMLFPGPQYWPRWIGEARQETRVWVDIDRATGQHTLKGSGLSVTLPSGFEGMDAAGESIVVRIRSADTYSLLAVDTTTGALETLVSSAEQLSLPAVANNHAAYLRRDGTTERIELVDVTSEDVIGISQRTGKPRWGRGQIANGRPLDYDGKRIVFAAGRRVLALDAGTAFPDSPPSTAGEGRLAFERLGAFRDRLASLIVASADRSSQLTLARVDTSFGTPNFSWSPDGSQLVLARHRNLYVIDADGSNSTQLTKTAARDRAPRWSPTGDRIVFERSSKGRTSLRSISPTGSLHTNITPGMDDAHSASWSPDGARLAFFVDELRPFRTHIYAADADGTNLSKLVTEGAGNSFSSNQRLSWSADGSELAYSTFGDSANVVALKTDGTGGFAVLVDTNRANTEPVFSSAGQLAFLSTRNGNPELYRANGQGSTQTRLTASPGSEHPAAFSPDGALVAYRVSHITRTSEIYLVPADGSSGPTRLTAPAGFVGRPVWQPAP